MPVCTTCKTYTPFLYTVYESAYNLRLEQCQKCTAFMDPYVEYDTLTLLLDLILLKQGVYRHLLYNRGSKPRRATSKLHDIHTAYLSRARWIWTIKLGAGLVVLDAFIRWAHLRSKTTPNDMHAEDSLVIFMRVLFGCLVETLAFHSGILLSCFTILSTYQRLFFKICSNTSPSSSITSTCRDFNYALIPLTLFYSSLTKLFLLFLLTIWTPASSSILQSHLQIQLSWFNAFSNPLKVSSLIISVLSKVLDDDKLDREWVIRNILGGMSAGFGLRVILDIHPFFSTLIILSGWASKKAMALFVGEWVGGDTQLSQVWLAHSIP